MDQRDLVAYMWTDEASMFIFIIQKITIVGRSKQSGTCKRYYKDIIVVSICIELGRNMDMRNKSFLTDGSGSLSDDVDESIALHN